ncbi:MAG: lipoate--protein ligase family protein [Propionibacteriaceae bacterium]|nr:lipoate--protein ligase family protein [Propionibacteriaceae bacterium]
MNPASSASFRGEYKVPGGKLVRVEGLTSDGIITQASLSGDFFIEPEDAIFDLNAALIGAPVNASVPQLVARLGGAIGSDAQLAGFGLHDVAVALRRGLGASSTWDEWTFDVIGPRVLPAAMHVAMDEVIAAEVSDGRRRPTLRFWDWDDAVVVIGSFQSVRNEIDEQAAKRHHVGVVRRITGGGAMFMEPGNCVTYSLVVPGSLVAGLSYEASYAYLDQWVLGALADVGVVAKFVPMNDIASDAGKIGGAAQRRLSDGTVLHHVTMSYDIDAVKMNEVLRIGREKLSDKGIRSAVKRVDPMRSQTGLSREAVIDAFIHHFMTVNRCQLSDYTADELSQAEHLVETKFGTASWTHRVA